MLGVGLDWLCEAVEITAKLVTILSILLIWHKPIIAVSCLPWLYLVQQETLSFMGERIGLGRFPPTSPKQKISLSQP